MSEEFKIMCIIYTETNGLHISEYISTKTLFGFARLNVLNYEIGYRKDNVFISLKKVRKIIKPRCMYITKEATQLHKITNEIANKDGIDIEDVLNDFIDDLKDVSVIISHNIKFHLHTILGEYTRYNIGISFSKYISIDTNTFNHKLENPTIFELYKDLYPTKKGNKNNLTLIKYSFMKLYEQYETNINNL